MRYFFFLKENIFFLKWRRGNIKWAKTVTKLLRNFTMQESAPFFFKMAAQTTIKKRGNQAN